MDSTVSFTLHASAPSATGPRPVCGERAFLRAALADVARQFGSGPAPAREPVDVQRHLRCTLEDHATADHHAFVMELDGIDTGSVWARWARGHQPATVLVLPDCPATSCDQAQEPCCEFAGHPGGHTWELDDPWRVESPPEPEPEPEPELAPTSAPAPARRRRSAAGDGT
jgi:hypothetical protein